MLSQNNDHLTNLILNADLNQINQVLILRLLGEVCGLECRVNVLEQHHEQIIQKLDKLEAIYCEIPHLVAQKDELQNLVDFYCPPD